MSDVTQSGYPELSTPGPHTPKAGSQAPTPDAVRDIMESRGRRTDGRYVRSYEESLNPLAYEDAAEEAFPAVTSDAEILDAVERRDFFKIAGAGMALAGLTACTKQPIEKIIPYGNAPEEIIPGKPLFYATAMVQNGIAHPVVVESHMGRPTKIEGNGKFKHGGTNVFAQASILDLYDPSRSTQIVGKVSSKRDLLQVINAEVLSWKEKFFDAKNQQRRGRNIGGKGVAILMEPTSSPTTANVLADLRAENSEIKLFTYSPTASSEHLKALNEAVDGNVPHYHFDKASVVLDLGADSLNPAFHPLEHAAGWASKRNFVDHTDALLAGDMNRLYTVETDFTLTGAAADHRLAATPTEIASFLHRLAAELGVVKAAPKAAEAPAEVPEVEDLDGGDKATTEIDLSKGADKVERKDLAGGGAAEKEAVSDAPFDERFFTSVLADLKAAGSGALVIAGTHLPASVQALALKLNEVLGGLGTTVTFAPSPVVNLDDAGGIADLSAALEAEEIRTLFILDSNPVYTAPASLNFAEKLSKAGTVFHLGAYEDETAELATWHIPLSHYLEAWGDARTLDGTVCVVQPLIAPLYSSSMSVLEMLMVLAGKGKPAHKEVMLNWVKDGGLSENDWVTSLHQGFIKGSAFEAAAVESISYEDAGVPESDGSLEVNFALDPSVMDGRFANNTWLQEVPTPLSTITWDNVITVSPKTADKFALDLGNRASKYEGEEFQKRHTVTSKVELVELTIDGLSVIGPVRISPGHADNCVTVTLGYGREVDGIPNAQGLGYNAYKILGETRTATGAEITGTGKNYEIAMTQDHHRMRSGNPDLGYRALAKHGTLNQLIAEKKLDAFGKSIQGDQHKFPQSLTMYRSTSDSAGFSAAKNNHQIYTDDRLAKRGTQWGMVIDLTRCVACNACIVACNAENNVAVVGKEQVMNGREMHWLRVDRYYDSADGDFADANKVSIETQPVTCMHCEEAGCEVVCPVGATVHSNDGLNQMVYNRCIGTRYCSNNCPYKVRRFNFLQYIDRETESLKLSRNPNVTVRPRGVMEKCTYCVQRINKARIEQKIDPDSEYNNNGFSMPEGAVVTACQQVCPTEAIAFGNICDDESTVSRYKAATKLNYHLLGEVNMRPRTSYIVRVRNKNAEVDLEDSIEKHKKRIKHIKANYNKPPRRNAAKASAAKDSGYESAPEKDASKKEAL